MCNIKTYISKLGFINISELCRYCGISRASWYNIIDDKKSPSVYVAIRITDYLAKYSNWHDVKISDLWNI